MHGRASKQYSFQSYYNSIFNAMRFDKSPFTCQCEKEDKKAYGFQISHFYWSFSSDTMAVKVLIVSCLYTIVRVDLSFLSYSFLWCVRACVRACLRACVSVWVSGCVGVCVRACVRACERLGMLSPVYVFACVHVCMYVCVSA